MKKERGITLIALIITIIILLILAGVSLNLVAGTEGILQKATGAVEKYNIATIEEEIELAMVELKIDYLKKKYEENEEGLAGNFEEYITDKLKNEGITTSNGEVRVEQDGITAIYEGKSGEIASGTYDKETGKVNITEVQSGVKRENIDVYGEVQKSGKTLAEYGITYTREGYAEMVYDDLYHLGMGSDSGVNLNTFTLTIDYDTLISQLGNRTFKGIYGEFHQLLYGDRGYTSWVQSEMIVTYKDGTTSNVLTEMSESAYSRVEEDKEATIKFARNKEVETIQMIIRMYDNKYGNAFGWIKNIILIV